MTMTVANVIWGILAGLISALGVWIFSSMWNVDAKRIVIYQAKRMQIYLNALNNDITWGYEDKKQEYYSYILIKVFHILACIDTARNSISFMNFRLGKRKKVIMEQLKEIEEGMNFLLNEVEGINPEEEIYLRIKAFKERYQTKYSNILAIRAEFLEKLATTNSKSEAFNQLTFIGEEDIEASRKVLQIV